MIENFRFISHLQEVIDEKDAAIERAMEIIGLRMERHAKVTITKKDIFDTGRLRNSITYATSKKHSAGKLPARAEDYEALGEVKEGEVVIGTNVEYAAYHEFGTSKMAARPYLEPTLTEHIDEYRKIVLSCLKN